MVRQTWHLRGTLLMNNLEMLTQREQLMEDIDSIIESFCMEMWEGKYPETQEELTRILCDAVCIFYFSHIQR